MKSSRRNFLFKSGAAATFGGFAYVSSPPIEALVESILNSVISRASAANQGPESYYLNVAMFGAPNRWGFDHFLKTRSSEALVNTPVVATNLASDGSSYVNTEHRTFGFMGVQVPHLWSTSVRSSTGTRPMSDLLKHMIVFRGYGTGVDGHPSNLVKQTSPLPSAGNITGHVADHSTSLLKAVQFPYFAGASAFSSPKGTGVTTVHYSGKANYPVNLLNSFGARGETSGVNSLHQRYQNLNENVRNEVRKLASVTRNGSNVVSLDQQEALKQIKLGIADLEQSWSALISKYESIASETFRELNVSGLSDLPIITRDDGSAESMWSMQAGTQVYYPTPSTDMRDWVRNANLYRIAAGFALAEFILTRKLASGFEMMCLAPENIVGTFSRSADKSVTSSRAIAGELTFDQHSMGAITSTFLNGCLFRAVGACLLSLIDSLKAHDMFEKTVIHLTQEFGRSPRNSGGGSDHGFDNMISSIFTGAHNGAPIVVGNIQRQGSNGSYPANVYTGSFGTKAITLVNGVETSLGPVHVASTIAHILRLPINPWGNVAKPLILRNSTGLEVKASAEVVG